MTETVIQFFVGGALLCFIVWLKLRDFRKGVELTVPGSTRLNTWLKTLTEVILTFFAVACLLDPLIPGPAELTIKVSTEPSTYPTLIENLRVCVTPFGFRGQAGGDRISCTAFDRDGSAEVVADLARFETRVHVRVFDDTRPSELIYSATVYVSPFVRRQLLTKAVTFSKRRMI